MRKESAIIRKCSAQRTGEPFHYASIQHILSNVMNAGILRSGETKSEVFPELQIVSLEQFNRVAKTREQRSVNYAIKCGGTTETVQLEDGTEATVVRPPRAYPRKIVGKALLSGNVYCGHCGGRIFAPLEKRIVQQRAMNVSQSINATTAHSIRGSVTGHPPIVPRRWIR